MTDTYDHALAPIGINIAQFALLSRVERHQPISLTELGEIAALDRSTVGRNVKVLERMGLVRTETLDGDRRQANVILTIEGTQMLLASTPLWRACQETMRTKLGPVWLDTMRVILDTL